MYFGFPETLCQYTAKSIYFKNGFLQFEDILFEFNNTSPDLNNFSIFFLLKNNLLYSMNKKSYPTCFIIQLIFRVQFNGVKRKGKRSVCDLWMQDIIYLAKISFYECKFHTELSAPFPAGMHQSIYMFSRGIDTWRHA